MKNNKIYYILLIFVFSDKYEIFNDYEDKVLPLLPKYNGKLESRLKTDKSANDADIPDEIHIISFKNECDFENFKNDSERKKYFHLFKSSVQKVELIKSKNLINS